MIAQALYAPVRLPRHGQKLNPSKVHDPNDVAILRFLQDDCRVPLDDLGKKINLPKSTLYDRIRRLEKEGVIEGYHAKLDASRLGYEYVGIVLVKARYGPHYHDKLGKKIAAISGVWATYYVYGEFDFIVLMRAKNREDMMRINESLVNMPDVERTNTQVAAKILKEDQRVPL